MKKEFVALALLASSQGAIAVVPPSAGSQIQQIPAAPVPEKATPELRIEPGNSAPAKPDDAAGIVVRSLHVVNAKAFSESELIAATGFKPGSELTLSALRALAAQIADYYHSHGYFLARATLPAQDVVGGAVEIVVIEGHYGKVVLRNHSRVSDAVAQQLLDGLNSGDAVTIAPLESRLLQLADLPGVEIKSTLVPGASVGASDLIVDVAPGRRVSGSIDADNSGNRYTGADRLGATLNVNNPLGKGDLATLRALSSFDGLDYGRAAYQVQFGKADVGLAYTAMHYRLGEEFDSLKAHGTAMIASVYGRYPLLRSRKSNLYLQLDFDAKSFRDAVDAVEPAVVSDKKAKVTMLSLVGDHRDAFGGGGLSTYSVTWSSGSLDIQSAVASATDASTARSDGHYDKLGATVTRLQSVSGPLSLYASLQGQWAAKNLDVSEIMELGGAEAVRAYPEGEAYVDEGYVLNLEAHLALPKFSVPTAGQLQLVGFLDTGTGQTNRNRWDAETNRRTLSGGGVGLNWVAGQRFAAKAYYAHKIGAAVATSAPDKDGRFWLNAATYF
ncbi:MAG: Polypeptide-transport-associated domain protein ShlB-type [Gammaproteobacteria bacterium]|nr:Polypeptide-transport-associated domain protein ShlB-type [Gammaproteobacteria bacterium]